MHLLSCEFEPRKWDYDDDNKKDDYDDYWAFLVNIPLTNQVRGPYCKLRTEFFPVDLWPKREARRPWINGKKRGSVTYSTDRENEVSKIFIISLRLIRRAGKETRQSQAEGSTATKIAVPKFQKLNLFAC